MNSFYSKSAPEVIAAKHGLELGVKLGNPSRNQAIKATTKKGIACVIKYGPKLNRHEIGLMRVAQTMDNLSFQVPFILEEGIVQGDVRYCVRQFIDRPHLADISQDPKKNSVMLDVLKNAAQDYQRVLAAYGPTLAVTPEQAAKEMARFLVAIASWEAKLLRANPASAKAIKTIITDLIKLYYKYGADFIGYAHGDIHGEHVLYQAGERPTLLDLNAQVRPGRGFDSQKHISFYDEIRALDSTAAHSFSPTALHILIAERIRELENRFDPQLVRAVMSARLLGVATDIEKDAKEGKNMPDLDTRRRLVRTFIEASRY
jgi:hypothetical protein